MSDPLLAAALMGAAATSAATIKEFERVLASQDSATAALGQWCERHGIAQAAQGQPQAGLAAGDAGRGEQRRRHEPL